MLQLSNRLPYNPKLQERAIHMRKNMTDPEKKLWFGFLRPISNWIIKAPPLSPSTEGEARESSRGRKMRVYRQRLIGHYIADFYIPSCKLVIEVDGESHFIDGWKEYDEERTNFLEWLWLRVLRFTNEEVMKNYEGVCFEIEKNVWGFWRG